MDLRQFFGKDLSFAHGSVDFLFENLRSSLEDLDVLRLALVADPVTLMILHDTLAANVHVVVFAEVLGFLVRVLGTKFLCREFFVFLFFFLLGHVFLTIQIVQNSKVLYQLLHVRRKIVSASRASQNV